VCTSTTPTRLAPHTRPFHCSNSTKLIISYLNVLSLQNNQELAQVSVLFPSLDSMVLLAPLLFLFLSSCDRCVCVCVCVCVRL
jgi:hypothetical protein